MIDLPTGLAGERAFFATSTLLFVASAGATVYWCRSMSSGMPMPGGWTMSMAWMRVPGRTWHAAASFMGMWLMMMMAMMLPSLMPMLSSYRRSLRGQQKAGLGGLTAIAGAGYFFVWAVFGAVTYSLGATLAAAVMRSTALAQSVPIAAGVVLMLAGCVQLTAWKARQLARCREAPACGQSPSADARSAWQQGLRFGVDCSLCCCGLMMVLFVVGVMNLGGMALVAAAITAERFSLRPARAARIAGVAVIAAGAVVIARVLGTS